MILRDENNEDAYTKVSEKASMLFDAYEQKKPFTMAMVNVARGKKKSKQKADSLDVPTDVDGDYT